MSVLNMCRTILSPGEYSLLWGWECRFSYVLYCQYGSCELFETQLSEIEKIDGQMKIETADLHGKHLTESEDHFTVTDVLLSENPVILTVKDYR